MAESISPSISVALSIDPPSFALSENVTLNVTAVLHAQDPITIFTWPNIFNIDLAQKRANFTCEDLNTGFPMNLEITKGPQRSGFNHELGGRDDSYHDTLQPEEPVTFKGSFKLASRTDKGSHVLTPGHRYRFGVREGEKIQWWREGKKEDALLPPGDDANSDNPSGGPIVLESVEPVEFEVKES
ncbi:MAG: hypothetical protein M1820_004576 [Bogoriella megaspora]|nr:MAG: hypothetical protein M1820_004576 [Bogoriella megaspora]